MFLCFWTFPWLVWKDQKLIDLEIDFPTRNAVDRFEGDSLYFMIMTVCAAIYFHNSLGPVCLIFSLQGLKCKLNLSLILAIFNIPVIPSPFTL